MSESENRDFAQEFYFAMKAAITGRHSRDAKRRKANAKAKTTKPFEKGRDPKALSAGIEDLFQSFGWNNQVSQAELFANWAQLVGDLNAANSAPEALANNILQVRCKSTAWATQLKLMHRDILAKVQQTYPGLQIEQIKFVGPQAPSWKKGQLSVPGRGPRDTYG